MSVALWTFPAKSKVKVKHYDNYKLQEIVKFIYSEKATSLCKISTVVRRVDLNYVVTVKSTVEISQNFVVV